MPNTRADPIPPGSDITLLNQDFSQIGGIPLNVVLGNNLEYTTTATLNYNGAGALEYKTSGSQAGSVYVGIEPFINGNLSISLRVNSDSWYSNVYIIGSTFVIQTQTLSDGRARVTSLYQTSPNSSSYQYYNVPTNALVNGVNTINIMVSGTTKTVRVYHDSTLGVTTPMYHWSVQKLPYAPMTLPILMFDNEKSSVATWVSTLLYGIKETVRGGVVSAVPGDDFVSFGIDFPQSSTNNLGIQYMSSHNQKGVAWADLEYLEGQPQTVQYIQSLLDSGWELGIHYNTSLTSRTLTDAQNFMRQQYNQMTAIFGRSPTTWCSYQNADNVSHAIFAYNELGMVWRNGYSGNDYIANIGNLQETRWPEFWSKVSAAQMVYPSFTHKTDQTVAEAYSISYSTFTKWIGNYEGKHIIGFYEYYYRIRNQIDTSITYLNYAEGSLLKFSVQCNQFQTRLLINFSNAANAVVLKNGNQLVKDSDYTVIDSNHIALFAQSSDVLEIRSGGVPDVPQNLAATAGNTQVSLIWSPPSYEGGLAIDYYIIYKDGSEVAQSNMTSYIDSGLTNGQSYSYAVAAHNSFGTGERSASVQATPRANPPGAPTGLTATPGIGSVQLSWVAPTDVGAGAIDYYILYQNDADISHPMGLSTTVSGITAGQAYTFEVAAHNVDGIGPRSTPVQATPLPDLPGAPTGLTATPGDSLVYLNWTAPSEGASGIDYYVIFQDGTPLANHPTQTSATITGLTNGQGYTFTVAAYKSGGIGPQSAPAQVTPRAVPGVPTGLVATPGNGQVSLSWIDPTNNGGAPIDYYVVYQDGAPLATHPIVSSLVVTDLSNGQTYSFRVAAHNVAGTGSESDAVSTTPKNTPGVPTDLMVQADNSQVGLSWKAPIDDGGSGIDYYVIYRDNSALPDHVVGLSTTITGLTNGQSYSFAVAAHNAAGEGLRSNSVVSTPFTIPDAPYGLIVTPGNNQVTLNWSAPAFNGGSPIDYYLVYQDGLELPSHVSGLSIIITGLSNGQSYVFKVAAHNAAGVGIQSSGISATPRGIPDAPTQLTAEVSGASVILHWQAPVSDGGAAIDYYRVKTDGVLGSTEYSGFTATINGLSNGLHTFRVVAHNAAGLGPESSEASATVQLNPPGKPTNLVATPGNAQVSLSWTAPVDIGDAPIDYYVIFQNSVELVIHPTGTSTTITGLTNGQTYNFAVAAHNSYGTGVRSDQVAATPMSSNIVITNPATDVTWYRNTTYTITWTANVVGNVAIELVSGTTVVRTISSSTANDGTQTWRVPYDLPLGSGYQIKIRSVSNANDFALSPGKIQISNPLVTVTGPNSASTVVAGNRMTVTWTSAGTIPGLRIQLLKGGVTILTLTQSTSNDGSQAFTLPFNLATGSDYVIRLTDTSNAAVTDDSDSFTIRAPSMLVTYPNGGETIVSGSSVNIQWKGDMTLLGRVNITLWQNGKLISTISSGTANDGSQSWTPSLSLGGGAGYSIRITPTSHPEFYDESNSTFSIRKPILVVTSPTAGSSYARSSTLTVNWQKDNANIGTIRIELYRNGALVTTLASSTSNDGTQSFRISSTITPGSSYQIKISSVTDTTILAWSGSFNIT